MLDVAVEAVLDCFAAARWAGAWVGVGVGWGLGGLYGGGLGGRSNAQLLRGFQVGWCVGGGVCGGDLYDGVGGGWVVEAVPNCFAAARCKGLWAICCEVLPGSLTPTTSKPLQLSRCSLQLPAGSFPRSGFVTQY